MCARAAVPQGMAWNLDDSEKILAWLARAEGSAVRLSEINFAEVWVLVALTALARSKPPKLHLDIRSNSKVGRFAHAIGMSAVIGGEASETAIEAERSVKMQSI